jgi:hypothetical protein
MLAKSLVQRLNPAEKSKTYLGALYGGTITGLIAYWNYRERVRKEFLRSEGHYRFSHVVENCTPWRQMYFTWFRMPY